MITRWCLPNRKSKFSKELCVNRFRKSKKRKWKIRMIFKYPKWNLREVSECQNQQKHIYSFSKKHSSEKLVKDKNKRFNQKIIMIHINRSRNKTLYFLRKSKLEKVAQKIKDKKWSYKNSHHNKNKNSILVRIPIKNPNNTRKNPKLR